MKGWGFLSVRAAESGTLISYAPFHNLDTTAGKNLMRDLYMGNSRDFPTHIALGTNDTPPTVDDIALYDEQVRTLITSRVPAEGQSTIRAYFGSTVGNGPTYKECGMFNAAGALVARAIFAGVAKTSAVTITINWIKVWT